MLLKLIIPVTEQLYIRNKTSGPEHVPCLQVLLYKKLSQFIADSEAFVTEQEADTDTLLVSIPHDRSLDGVATAMSQ